MKKLLLSLTAVLCLLLWIAVPVLAAETDPAADGPVILTAEEAAALMPETVYVTDRAYILTSEELSSLEEQAREVSETYGCGVYVQLVYSYEDYGIFDTTTRESAVRVAAERAFTQERLGLGEDQSGVLLLLSMAGRDYALIAHGYGNTAFTDYGKEVLVQYFLDDFRHDDWYGGLSDYINYSGKLLERARNGDPLDVSYGRIEEPRSLREALGVGGMALVILCPPLLIALIACEVMRAKMKSVRKATNAMEYAVPNSLNMLVATDQFTHITQTRVRVESDSSRGGGGGGGTSVNSGGFSGTSGKF